MMTNKQLDREIKSFMKLRRQWVDMLNKNPENTSAAEHVIRINAQIDLLRTYWGWAEEGEVVDFPYGDGS